MTLLEVMAVVTIMVLLLGIAFPKLSGTNEKSKLRSAAREIVALMRYARTEAVFGERVTEVYLDAKNRKFWLDLKELDPKTRKYNPKRKKRQIEQERKLNGNIWFEEITAYDSNILSDEVVVIDFYPDGTASPIMLTLKNERGSRLTVEVLKSTGMTEVTPGSIEEKKERELQEEQHGAPAPAGGMARAR